MDENVPVQGTADPLVAGGNRGIGRMVQQNLCIYFDLRYLPITKYSVDSVL